MTAVGGRHTGRYVTVPVEYPVFIDLARLAGRRRVLLAMRVVPLAVQALGLMAVVSVPVLLGPYPLLPALFHLLTVAALLVSAGLSLTRFVRLRLSWSAPVPPVVMRMTATGVHLNLDTCPHQVYLPWTAICRLRLHRWIGQPFLVLDVYPDVNEHTPGTRGLDHPTIHRALRHRMFGTTGLRFCVDLLPQPLADIDHMLAVYTAGRVRITGLPGSSPRR